MGDFNPLLPEDPERVGVHILVGRLGQDPQQAVYLGHLPDEETLRVIRVLAPRPEATPQAREQITNGLHAAKRVSGAHTAKLIEVGWFDDSPYIVREHVEGRSLRQAVTADGPLTGDALEHLAVTTLTALTAIHLAGLTHDALTPDTVILGPDGPRVCDIGLGITSGEPDYRAPENLHAELNPGAAPTAGRPADLFSWAAALAYAATGKPPFGGELPRVMEGPADLTGIPAELAALLASCLDKNPHARPDTKAAMLRLLGEQSAVLITGDDTWQDEALPAVPQQPAPAQAPPPAGWGAPPLPQDPAPPAQATFVLRGAAQPGERPKRGGFSLVLVACVGVVALLSGLGLWAAGSYTSLGEAERAAANAAAAPHASLGLVDQGQQGPGQPQGDGQGIGVGDGVGEEPPDKVTVPWGATTDPQNPDVGPMQLNTGSPTVPAPSMTSFVTPPAIPTNAPVPPTAVPTAAPTAPPAPTATPSPSTTATVTVTPTPSATPTPPRVDPTPAPTATPSPSTTPRPSEPATETPAPAPSEPATETPTAKPTPPAVAPKPTPKPSATQTATVRPTPPAATPKPTPKPSSPPPVVEPTQPPAPTVKPTPPPATTKPTQSPAKSAPPAARSNPYTPQQACGSGYYVQRSASFPGGTTYQLYNTSTGSNCVVTMKTADVGTATSVWATLEVQGGSSKTDRGNFEYYAGGVILSSKGKCVRFSGGGPGGSTGTSSWANCG